MYWLGLWIFLEWQPGWQNPDIALKISWINGVLWCISEQGKSLGDMPSFLTIEEAKKGERNVYTFALIGLLREWGFESGEDKISWSHPDHPELKLDLDPAKPIAHPNIVKEGARICDKVRTKQLDIIRHPSKQQKPLPAWLSFEDGNAGERLNNTLITWNKECPELVFRHTLQENQEDERTYALARRAFRDTVHNHKQELKYLSSRYGFEAFRDDKDGICYIMQPDLDAGVKRNLPMGRGGTVRDLQATLIAFRNEVKNIYDARLSECDGLDKNGFKWDFIEHNGRDAIEIKGKDLEEPVIIPLYWMENCIKLDGLENIRNLIDPPKKVAEKIAVVELTEDIKVETPAAESVTPAEEDETKNQNEKRGRKKSPVVLYKQYSGKDFGHLVIRRSSERGMNPEEVAREVCGVITAPCNITERTVRLWHRNREVPEYDVYKALEQVLIHDNDKIPPIAKDVAAKAFFDAYEKTKKALEDKKDVKVEDVQAFSKLLDHYQEQVKLTDHELAMEVKEKYKWDGLREQETPANIDEDLILDIITNQYQPSFGLARAIIKAIDQEGVLSKEEKQGMFDAFAGIKTDPVKEIIRKRDKLAITPEENIDALRLQMYQIFIPLEYKQITALAFSIDPKNGLNDTVLKQILGTGPIKTMKIEDWEKHGRTLEAVLNVLNKTEDAEKFSALYKRFTGCAPKVMAAEAMVG